MNVKDITGMSIQDFNKLTKIELRQMSAVLISALNKRIKREVKEFPGLYSPSLRAIADRQGVDLESGKIPKLSTKGFSSKDIDELRHEAFDLITIAKHKTGTLGGFREYRAKIEPLLSESVKGDYIKEREFWRGYLRFRETEEGKNYSSKQVVTWMREQDLKGDRDDIYKKLEEERKRGTKPGAVELPFGEKEVLIPTTGELSY